MFRVSTYSEHYESALVLLGHADDDPSHAPTFLAAAQTHALLATMRLVEQILVGLDAENPISISDLIADIIAPLKLGGDEL